MAEITPDTLNGLAEKIDSLELTETEQAVLEHVLARAGACESEVEGFASRAGGPKGWLGISTGVKIGFKRLQPVSSSAAWITLGDRADATVESEVDAPQNSPV